MPFRALPLFALLLALNCPRGWANDEAVRPLQFRVQEIDRSLGVGYAVLLVDVNHDDKLDIVVVDTTRVVWYENPTWKRRIIIENQTKPDNVCITAHDIDGDGQVDFALGADWRPADTKTGGTIQWLKRGKSLDEKWTVHPIGEEPTVHRMRFAHLEGRDKPPVLLVGPLFGRNSSRAKNWMDGEPVRLLSYRIPQDPVKDRWVAEVLDQNARVMHNFWPVENLVFTASYDGVHTLARHADGTVARFHTGSGDQGNPSGSRGASEIKLGISERVKDDQGQDEVRGLYLATIEPWHGDKVAVYTPRMHPPARNFRELGDRLRRIFVDWNRTVLDTRLQWGHAVWCADLDGDGREELIIGVRDNLSMNPGERCGVRIYKPHDAGWAKWDRQLVDEGGVAVEDLAAADLDGDGKIDLVAVGRATKNVRIYWNQGRK
jgi:hypothetical protein